ncbi:MAG TPA: hypothetical protein VN851_04535 [Thermoanaerobaculia bacterium]|nr:hypothetical protein [Thermoanaerobaculia bacterium]
METIAIPVLYNGSGAALILPPKTISLDESTSFDAIEWNLVASDRLPPGGVNLSIERKNDEGFSDLWELQEAGTTVRAIPKSNGPGFTGGKNWALRYKAVAITVADGNRANESAEGRIGRRTAAETKDANGRDSITIDVNFNSTTREPEVNLEHLVLTTDNQFSVRWNWAPLRTGMSAQNITLIGFPQLEFTLLDPTKPKPLPDEGPFDSLASIDDGPNFSTTASGYSSFPGAYSYTITATGLEKNLKKVAFIFKGDPGIDHLDPPYSTTGMMPMIPPRQEEPTVLAQPQAVSAAPGHP